MVPGKFPANGDGRHLPNQSLMERGSIVCQLATQQVIHETLLRNRRGPFNMAYSTTLRCITKWMNGRWEANTKDKHESAVCI